MAAAGAIEGRRARLPGMTSRARQPAWLTALGFTAVFLLLVWLVRFVLVGTLLDALLGGG